MNFRKNYIFLLFLTAGSLLITVPISLYAQTSFSISGYELLQNNDLEKGFTFFPGSYFVKNNILALPAINEKGKSLLRYYKMNGKGELKFKNEEDVFIPESYELTGALSMTDDKKYFVFSAMNGTLREPDLFYAVYNDTWKHYNIRVLGEINYYESMEKNPMLNEDGSKLYFLNKGQLILTEIRKGSKVFEFPKTLVFSGLENRKILAFDIDPNGNTFYLLVENKLYAAVENARGRWQANEIITLNHEGGDILGFHIRDGLVVFYVRTNDRIKKYQILIFSK